MVFVVTVAAVQPASLTLQTVVRLVSVLVNLSVGSCAWDLNPTFALLDERELVTSEKFRVEQHGGDVTNDVNDIKEGTLRAFIACRFFARSSHMKVILAGKGGSWQYSAVVVLLFADVDVEVDTAPGPK